MKKEKKGKREKMKEKENEKRKERKEGENKGEGKRFFIRVCDRSMHKTGRKFCKKKRRFASANHLSF